MAYRAEIEIGVKGVKELDKFQSQLERLSNEVDRVNKKKFTIGNLSSYNEALRKANETLNQTEIETSKAGKATGLYKKNLDAFVTALLTANSAQTLNNKLVKEEIDGRNAAARAIRNQVEANLELSRASREASNFGGGLDPVAKSIARRRRKLAGDPNVYAAPAGPVPSELQGQSSLVAERIQRQLKGERDLQEVKERLAQLDQESIRAHNARLNLQAEYLTVLRTTADAALFRAQQPASSLALPEFKERGLRLLDNSVKANESQLRIETALNGQRQRGVRFLEKQTAEEQRQLNLGITGTRTNLLPQSLTGQTSPISPMRTAAGARAATGFPVALQTLGVDVQAKLKAQNSLNLALQKQNSLTALGVAPLKAQLEVIMQMGKNYEINLRRLKRINQAQSLRFKKEKAQQRARKAGQVAIGAAFPALFGAGPGGILGGAVGESFGPLGGVVGSAIGSQIDIVATSIIDLGLALNPLSGDLTAVSTAAGLAGTSTGRLLESLKGQIDETRAAQLAADQLAAVVGESGVMALQELGEASNELGREAAQAFSAIAAAIAPLLTAVIVPVASAIEDARLLSKGARTSDPDPELARLQAQQGSVNPFEAFEADRKIVELMREREAQEKRIAASKLQSVTTSRVELDIAQRQNRIKKLGTDLTDKNNIILNEGLIRTKAQAEQDSLILDFVNEKITRADYDLKLKAIQLNLDTELLGLAEDAADAQERKTKSAERELKIEQDKLRRAAEATRLLSISADLAEYTTGQDKAIANALRDGNKELAYKLQIARELTILDFERSKIQDQTTSTTDKNLKNRIAEAQTLGRLNSLEGRRLDLVKEAKQKVEQQISRVQDEIDLSKARIEGRLEEEKIDQAINNLRKESTEISEIELSQLRQKLELLNSQKSLEEAFNIQQKTKFAGAGLQAGFIGQAGKAFESKRQEGASIEDATRIANLTQEMEIAQAQAQALESAVLGIGNAFATAMTTGVSELVAGTKSAQEVFADFLKNIGDALVNAATQMIATYIAIGIAKAFAGMGSNMGGNNYFDPKTGLGVAGPNFGKANGGPVSGGQPYMVGERGPELFVPGQSGGVMRNEDMRSLMGRSPASGGAPSMNFSFETTSIGGTEYVSREQLESAMAVTRKQASNDGAKRGMNMTLDKMQNSPRTRTRIGLR